jgi:hypothetical protein
MANPSELARDIVVAWLSSTEVNTTEWGTKGGREIGTMIGEVYRTVLQAVCESQRAKN